MRAEKDAPWRGAEAFQPVEQPRRGGHQRAAWGSMVRRGPPRRMGTGVGGCGRPSEALWGRCCAKATPRGTSAAGGGVGSGFGGFRRIWKSGNSGIRGNLRVGLVVFQINSHMDVLHSSLPWASIV